MPSRKLTMVMFIFYLVQCDKVAVQSSFSTSLRKRQSRAQMSLRDVQGSKFNATTSRFKAATQRFKGLSADLICEGYRGCEANGIEWRACHDDGLASFSKRLQAVGEQHCPLVIHTAERVIDDDTALIGCRFLIVEHLERIGERLR